MWAESLKNICIELISNKVTCLQHVNFFKDVLICMYFLMILAVFKDIISDFNSTTMVKIFSKFFMFYQFFFHHK